MRRAVGVSPGPSRFLFLRISTSILAALLAAIGAMPVHAGTRATAGLFDSGSATVASRALNELAFDPPLALAPGDSVDLSFAGKLEPHQRQQSSAQTLTALTINNSLGTAPSLGLRTKLSTVTKN